MDLLVYRQGQLRQYLGPEVRYRVLSVYTYLGRQYQRIAYNLPLLIPLSRTSLTLPRT